MTDFLLGTSWVTILVAGLAIALAMRAVGVAATYVRDFLHIGAGVWVLGWPWWHGSAIAVVIVATVAIGVALVPSLRGIHFVAKIHDAVTNGDERWSGLVLYTIAYAIFTIVGLGGDRFAAGAGLLALSLGDGIGGAVGRVLGEHHYRAPGGKQKSIEGSLVVACGALAGALLAAILFHAPVGIAGALVLGIVAALTEAFSPRGTDNLLVPTAVFIAAHFV